MEPAQNGAAWELVIRIVENCALFCFSIIPAGLACLMVRSFLLRTRTWPHAKRRSFGTYTAVLGILPFLFCWIVLTNVLPEIPPHNVRVLGYVAANNSIIFMALMSIIGAIDLAVCKGYSPRLGFVMGLFSVVGLLILVLLPDGLPQEIAVFNTDTTHPS